MTKPLITIHDQATDEVVTREMTDLEFAQYEKEQAKYAAIKAEAEAKEQAKLAAQTKLEALGLTVEDLQALGL